MDLISRAQRMFPTASPDDINRGITHFKSIDPEMTDDDILTNAQKVIAEKQAPIATTPVSPVDSSKVDMVKQNLRSKYGMDDASAANRQAIVDQNTEDASGVNWRAGLATLGAGLMGQNAIAAGESVLSRQAAERQGKLTEFDKARSNKVADFNQEREISKAEREDLQFSQDQDKLKREQDPNSEESKMAQDLAKAMGMGNVTGLTAAKFKEFSPALQKKYEIEQNKLNRQEARAARQQDTAIRQQDKQLVRDEKKKTTLNEVEDRRTNIEDNITQLENMIKDKGTYELFGSHNADLDRRVEMIATDMAKLADPNSVARPSEVEAFKKGLIQSNAAGMRNSTALDILKNFRNEVNQRTENAYKIRGLDNPGSQAQKSPSKIKVSNGKETLEIDADDVSDAEKDGYRRI